MVSRSVLGIVGAGLALALAGPSSVSGQAQPVPPTPLPVPRPAPAAPGAPAPAPPPAAQATPPAAPQPGVTTPGRAGRDPFDPLVTKPVEPAAAPGDTAEKRQPLSGLRLVGVVWDARDRQQIRALVETPDGLGYYVRVNEEKFGGRVVAIERDVVRFSVREQIPGGAARERTVELKLGSK
jgi:hypothetical protein